MAVLQLLLAWDTDFFSLMLALQLWKLRNKQTCTQPMIHHSKQFPVTATWLNWFRQRELHCALLCLLSHQFAAGWSEAAGCIDVTPCPRPGQIVCINGEIGGLCPLRLRSGQEETGETESLDIQRRSSITCMWDYSFWIVWQGRQLEQINSYLLFLKHLLNV